MHLGYKRENAQLVFVKPRFNLSTGFDREEITARILPRFHKVNFPTNFFTFSLTQSHLNMRSSRKRDPLKVTQVKVLNYTKL